MDEPAGRKLSVTSAKILAAVIQSSAGLNLQK